MQDTIGFIGQGFVGKNLADDCEARGFPVVRYSREEQYAMNKEKIAECSVVFIAVPTPTVRGISDDSIVREAVGLVGKSKIAVIKSTVVPGTSKAIQEEFPDKIIVFCPEFLSADTAAYDAAHPFMNVIGVAGDMEASRAVVEKVYDVLPVSKNVVVCGSTEAEIIKYLHNGAGFINVVFFNIMRNLSDKLGCDWVPIETAAKCDPFLASQYVQVEHKGGRGAGGACFIKDFSALELLYRGVKDASGRKFLSEAQAKNIELLISTKKDLNLLTSVFPPRQ